MIRVGWNENSSSREAEPVRLGWIDYLNSLPVYHALDTGAVALPADVELVRGAPTELNDKLLRGDLDVSPVSSIAYAKHAQDLVLLPDLSINSTGFVHSVCLFYRNGLDSLQGGTIAVTAESATSLVLLRALMRSRLGLDATLVQQARPDLEEIGKSVDGVLFIGDNAMKAALAYPQLGRLDLGDEWTRWTGTPMVFAVWCARKEFAHAHPAALAQAHAALLAGKEWGRRNRSVIVEDARRRLFQSRAYMERYFRDLSYDLDAPKLAGLRRYYEEALALGEIARVPPLAPLEVRA